MRAFVFTDPALASSAGRFVWLDLDTEKPANAAALEKLPMDAWPTYFVLDPRSERVLLRWVGAMTVAQLRAFLEEGGAAFAAAGRSAAESALARADRLYGAGQNTEAVEAYREALAAAPAGWPQHGRAVEAQLFALQRSKAWAEGAGLAREALPRLAGTPHAFVVALGGLDCALSLEAEHPRRAEWLAAFESEVRRRLADPPPGVAADDRSSAYASLLAARKKAEDRAGARRTAEEWARFLEGEAARARTPEERAVFDSHRLTAYLELGQAESAIPMLEASERALPGDYNPPARLAVAYQALARWDDALAAVERALAKVYGRRKLRVLQVRWEVEAAKGDPAAARRTLAQALAYAESLPEALRSEAAVAAIRKQLEAMR